MRAGAFAASFLPRANLTSIIVLAINCTFFCLQLALNYKLYGNFDLQIDLGAEIRPYIVQGQWWRLFTAGFLHAGFLHIAMNSWSLFILVTEVEQFYGTSRLIVAYVVSTFTGFFCAFLFSSGYVLGASAAAFGLMGTMLAMGLRDRSDPLSQAVRQHYGQWLVFGLVMSLGGGISMTAHIGGLAGGFLVGMVAGRPALPDSPRETFWKVMALLALLIVTAAWAREFQLLHAHRLI